MRDAYVEDYTVSYEYDQLGRLLKSVTISHSLGLYEYTLFEYFGRGKTKISSFDKNDKLTYFSWKEDTCELEGFNTALNKNSRQFLLNSLESIDRNEPTTPYLIPPAE